MERGANHAEDPHLPRTTGKAGENTLSARRLLRFPREYYTCSFIKMQPHASINYIAHISIIQLPDKLGFGGFASKYPVIANQSADWCGNPPVERNQVTITTKNRKVSRSVGQLSIHFSSNRGIATPLRPQARPERNRRRRLLARRSLRTGSQ